MSTHHRALLALAAALTSSLPAIAETFGSGEFSFEIQFVAVGSPGNPADSTGNPSPAGSVPYSYKIGKYEVPEEAIEKANAASAAAGSPLNLTLFTERGPQKPATGLSWFEAAQFVNWLNEDKGYPPAYKFNDQGEFELWAPEDPGHQPSNPFRNSRARYVLPSTNEWYKAAFYDPLTGEYFDFPTGSNAPPIPTAGGTDPGTAVYQQAGPADVMLAGGESPLMTVGQAGNVWEWEETQVNLSNSDPLGNRGFRGDDWSGGDGGDFLSMSSSFRHFIQSPGNSVADIGFRVAVVPEPSSTLILQVLLTFMALAPRFG